MTHSEVGSKHALKRYSVAFQGYLCDRKGKTTERSLQLITPAVSCSSRGLRAVFGSHVKSNIRVRDKTGALVPVPPSEGPCGVKMRKEKNQGLSFFSRPDSCYAQVEGNMVVVPLQAQLTGEDHWFRVNISCPLIKKSSKKTGLETISLPGTCDTPRNQRIDCGHVKISGDACLKLGCCYNPGDLTCYYRLNTCSLDGHFVFSVETSNTDQPINPGDLIIKGHPQCVPSITTKDTAIFMIHVMDCGVEMKTNRDVQVFELEVEELPAGNVNDHSDFSLRVQCEYEAQDVKHVAQVRSLYSATNPPPVIATGTIKMQMRIATDPSFTSFFPENQLPLMLPLREAIYVEVSITEPSPDNTLSLHVRDCFAYPASRHSVWTLLYDGCPNPLDDMSSSVPVDNNGKISSNSQVRRFDVKTFAFLEKGHASAEEVFFFCWVDICTEDVDCLQRCTLVSSESKRWRREAAPLSHSVQLVSFGPLQLEPDIIEAEEKACVLKNKVYQVAAYALCGLGATLLVILLLALATKGWMASKS